MDRSYLQMSGDTIPCDSAPATHRLAQAKAGSGTTAGTCIDDKADGVRAPTMWLTRLFHHRMIANRPFLDRIALRAAVRRKLIACDIDPRHSFWVGSTSYGEFRYREFTGNHSIIVRVG